jgi:hypothetical protein
MCTPPPCAGAVPALGVGALLLAYTIKPDTSEINRRMITINGSIHFLPEDVLF